MLAAVWGSRVPTADFLFDVVDCVVFQLVDLKTSRVGGGAPLTTALVGAVQVALGRPMLRQPLSLAELGPPVLKPDLEKKSLLYIDLHHYDIW